MSGWQNSIFGNLPPTGEPIPSGPPARPPSRGTTFGANYQGLPTSPNIDDRRQDPANYAYWMRRAPGIASTQYPPSEIGDPSGFVNTPGRDLMPLARFIGPNPPIGYQPISPGDPGWTPPPSPSGPHNPQGDPNRPGWGGAIGMPNTLPHLSPLIPAGRIPAVIPADDRLPSKLARRDAMTDAALISRQKNLSAKSKPPSAKRL